MKYVVTISYLDLKNNLHSSGLGRSNSFTVLIDVKTLLISSEMSPFFGLTILLAMAVCTILFLSSLALLLLLLSSLLLESSSSKESTLALAINYE